MSNEQPVPTPLPDPRHPVWYFPVTADDGEIVGYVWGDHTVPEVGWARRAARTSRVRALEGKWAQQVFTAGQRQAAPVVVVAGLARAKGAGAVVGASSTAVVEALARTVTEADDHWLLAQLHDAAHDSWRELADAFDALSDEDRSVEWGGGGKQPNGVIHVAYPRYSEPLMRVFAALYAVGAVTPEYRWTEAPLPKPDPDGRLAPADAVRAATTVVVGERISEGMIADAAKDGLLDAIGASLRAWRAGRTPPTVTTAPDPWRIPTP
ncbi:DUF6508 domain-containing protein [Streptomyces sp. NPDC005811]|uniref:DUF6508 domain-containing protein n=1 Tax=Streptomyces sp. NPDC005811 TaxID=3154565 RepID=UPI0033F3A841